MAKTKNNHFYDGIVAVLINRAQKLQAPLITKYIHSLRAAHPDESPAQILDRVENRFTALLVGSGGAVGATAAMPGIGTVSAFAAIGVEAVFVIEASALLALSTAEIYGIPASNHARRKELVLAVAQNGSNSTAINQTTAGVGVTQALSKSGSSAGLIQRYGTKLITRFGQKRAPLLLGRILPAGIGVAAGTAGNLAVAKKLIAQSHKVFGPPPLTFSTPLPPSIKD